VNDHPWILGISASHNGSACLLKGDELSSQSRKNASQASSAIESTAQDHRAPLLIA
jgi:hypothetical protein